MTRYFLLVGMMLSLVFFSCKKNSDGMGGVSCDLPSTSVPEELQGNWASGYNSFTDIVDAYNGQVIGNAWQSGKLFHFENNGKNAQFFYMANGGTYSSTATKVIGTVEFLDDQSFIFHACKAHYKGWQNGALRVDRDATSEEVTGSLTQKYYYDFVTSGGKTWLQIKFDQNDEYGSSFEQVP